MVLNDSLLRFWYNENNFIMAKQSILQLEKVQSSSIVFAYDTAYLGKSKYRVWGMHFQFNIT